MRTAITGKCQSQRVSENYYEPVLWNNSAPEGASMRSLVIGVGKIMGQELNVERSFSFFSRNECGMD